MVLCRRSPRVRLGDRMRRARHGSRSSRRSGCRCDERRCGRLYDGRFVARRSTVADGGAAAGRWRRLLLRRRRVRSRCHAGGGVGDRCWIRCRLTRRLPRRCVTSGSRREHHEGQDDNERTRNLRVSCNHPRWMSADGGHAVPLSNLVRRQTRLDPSNAEAACPYV
jgi:hypothetical protein